MPAHRANQRWVIASIASNERWSKTLDTESATAAARQAANDRFLRQVDPDHVLLAEERARRAERT
ncbi:MAG TPA: hypothetical protein VKP64_00715 [Mycobacteriales bacterium]|nr:hypothetical protein [Mycobacteriales bacterium]